MRAEIHPEYKEITVTCRDFLKINICCLCKSNKSKIIQKALKFIDDSLNEENFALNKAHDQILKAITLDKEIDKLLVFPSINVHKDISSSIFFIDSKNDDSEDSFNSDEISKVISNELNNEINRELINEITSRRYFELDQRDSRYKALLELYLMNNI